MISRHGAAARMIWMRISKACSLTFVLVTAIFGVSTYANADVIEHFENVAGSPSGEFGWDDFNGASYGGPQKWHELRTEAQTSQSAYIFVDGEI